MWVVSVTLKGQGVWRPSVLDPKSRFPEDSLGQMVDGEGAEVSV